jgi:hypothetical protein
MPQREAGVKRLSGFACANVRDGFCEKNVKNEEIISRAKFQLREFQSVALQQSRTKIIANCTNLGR